MELYLLEPEVAGGLGENTVFGTDEEIRKEGGASRVQYLHYKFDGWLGDALLECTPCFIITKELNNQLMANGLNDYSTQNCDITTSEEFEELYPNKKLPEFIRLIPLGTVHVEKKSYSDWTGKHFSLSQRSELVVTKEILSILESYIKYSDITPLKKL
ncbi:hypothetical protein [Exiguobacterium algae]|uniref:hypothetical protein n=1 Tax=Exiguobacterium algae TaxID=2751250 RepID=UPI001BEA872E|nr:hypothetical protein [Exiguobacterium algae]